MFALSTVQSEREARLKELMHIAVALTAERNLNRLLDLILLKARELTHADAGSLYLTETDSKNPEQILLRFMLSQNDSVQFSPPHNIVIPADENSIAGYVAKSCEPVNLPDVYQIDPQYPFHFNAQFDETTGYRTRSVLAIPLKTLQGEVIGVIQLINRKTDHSPLVTERDFKHKVQPFSSDDEELLHSLASQAAIALQTNRLLNDIERLFQSFIQASILAIEQRDPTTKGHSQRVARLTVNLARAVNQETTGPYANVHFNENQLKEIYYAAILHDVGKIGVREHVLVKQYKLYDVEMERIRRRFSVAILNLRLQTEKRKIDYLKKFRNQSYELYFKELDSALKHEEEKLESYLRIIEQANLPTVLPEGDFRSLQAIAQETYIDLDGTQHPLLEPHEISRLSIPKGNLDTLERAEIESHVTKSFEFLSQIPWTHDLLRVPEIAYGHHEKSNGSGYPRGLNHNEIPIQSRMMTIADIFDALTAQDRPYKKSVPTERALEILQMEVSQGNLDPELFRIFRERQIWTWS